MQLPQLHVDILKLLRRASGPQDVSDIAGNCGVDQSPAAAACMQLEAAGLISIAEEKYEEFRIGDDGRRYADEPLPERIIVGVLLAQGGACKLTEIPNHCALTQQQVGQSLRMLQQRNWARKSGEMLELIDGGASVPTGLTADEALLRVLNVTGEQTREGFASRDVSVSHREAEDVAGNRRFTRGELTAAGVPVDEALKLLASRKNFVVVKERTTRRAALTDAGRALLEQGVTAEAAAVTQLTPELLADGGWRNVRLAEYDVTLAAKTIYPGKEHPFQRTLDRVRRVFLEMGFEEIVSPWVESSFWDFDALFQPQDHPARDMQDTFYVARPSYCALPDEKLVERVKAVHENGGGTGSTGWQYRWRKELAHKPVLRTHTTAATIRALARHKPGTPGKYFVIGPVFRRETVDYKHLPVFHQVDGIIVDPQASLATLLGMLKVFYRKMGFEDVAINPSFFPYTEPSAEVLVHLASRDEWVEMGGSGIFRPEVTQPLGIRDRVLAWGLGLERLAMMIHNLKSIGELYFAKMPWLREAPLRQS